MTYTTEADIEAMAGAMRRALYAAFPDNGTSDAFEGRALNSTISAWMDVAARAAHAASPVHAAYALAQRNNEVLATELAWVKAECERLREAIVATIKNVAKWENTDVDEYIIVRICTEIIPPIFQVLKQKESNDGR